MRTLLVAFTAGLFATAAFANETNEAAEQTATETAPPAATEAEAAPEQPVDCTTLEGEAKTACEAAAAATEAAAATPEAAPAKGGKAQRSNSNRMESEFVDE